VPVAHPEQVTAVRFDGARAFVVTFQRQDPLFTIDLADPAKPRVAGMLEAPGWLDHLEPRGKWLIAVGHDRMGDPNSGPWLLSVSLVDVGDLAHPRLAARETFGAGPATLPGQRDDWQKVFRVLDGDRLLLVPFRSLLLPDAEQPWRKAEVGTLQLVDFDLAAGTIKARGLIPQDDSVQRALGDGRGHVLSGSDETVQIDDIANRDAPARAGSVTLARYAGGVLAVGDAAVALGAPGGGDGPRTRLTLLAAGDPDGSALATLDLPLERVASISRLSDSRQSPSTPVLSTRPTSPAPICTPRPPLRGASPRAT
jgi:hypothetical protein